MKTNDWKKTKTIYWSDEYNEDFNDIGLSRPSLPEDYRYLQNKITAFLGNILYFGIAIPVLGLYCLFHGIRFKNRKYLRECRKTGAVIYSNHVAISDVFKFQTLGIPTKKIHILGYSDASSIPVARKIVKSLGYIPIPNKDDPKNFLKMNEAITALINKYHHYVLIYPEAHIWPYYTKIRHFKEGSFRYPVNANCPIIPAVTVWKKRLLRKKPHQLVIIGKPIYPIKEYDSNQNKIYLHDACFEAMKSLSESINQQEFIKYIKKDN